LISFDGKQIGIVTPQEGIRLAREAGLDLVEISSTAKPPVCRILDFGKYLYVLEKQEKKAKKKQHIIVTKEIKMSPKIDDHDYHTKLRSAFNFFERGDKVKLTLFFRGREVTHPELGQRIVSRFTEDVADIAELERRESTENRRTLVFVFTPKKQPKKKIKVQTPGSAEAGQGLIDAKVENEQSNP
jgi:translation initiation factor IF-3